MSSKVARAGRARPEGESPTRSGRAPSAQGASEDVVLVHGVTEDGDVAVLRQRDQALEAGLLRPIREGEPPDPNAELIKLKPRPHMPLLCDVEVQVARGTVNARGGSDRALPAPARALPTTSRKGPAQVATRAYRTNWDAIWDRGAKAKPN